MGRRACTPGCCPVPRARAGAAQEQDGGGAATVADRTKE